MKSIEIFKHDKVQGYKFGSNPFGKPKMFSHVYFIDGLLIDTGHRNMKAEVFTTLSTLPVTEIFITHHHEDHTGNLPELQSHFNCPAWSSALCQTIMKSPPKISFAQKLFWGNRPPFHKLQVQENLIITPKHKFKIIRIPGHAADMICLYEAEQGWLFSADLFVSAYIKYFMREECLKTQINSIKKILTLNFDVLFCSHNPQFKDGKAKLQNKLHFLEDFYQQVVTLQTKGLSTKEIFQAMHLKENWAIRILSTGALSTLNMVKSVVRGLE